MKYFAPSYLITTSLALLSSSASRLAGTFPTGENTTITKASNNSSGLAITPNQHTDFTNQYFDEAFIKIIKEAANAPTYPDHTAEKLKLERAERSKLIEHETPVNGDDLVSLFAEPAENSDVVHHRSARDATETFVVKEYVDLPNQNCLLVAQKSWMHSEPVGLLGYGIRKANIELYAKCIDDICQNQQVLSTEGTICIDGKYSLKFLDNYIITTKTTGDQQVVIKYKINDNGNTHELPFACPSDAYQHVQNAKTLALNGNTTKAMEEIEMALNIRPDYKLAMELQAKILESLASTTIEPSPSSAENSTLTANSTTITEENTPNLEPHNAPFNRSSTPTANSTNIMEENTPNLEPHNAPFNRGSTPTVNSTNITEENTPNLEPHNAPFNRGSVPTAAPHEQTTEGQGWSVNDLYKAIISGVVIVGAIGGIITFAYKKGTAIYHACQEHCSKLEETSFSGEELYHTMPLVIPNVEDINLMGNASGGADSSEITM